MSSVDYFCYADRLFLKMQFESYLLIPQQIQATPNLLRNPS